MNEKKNIPQFTSCCPAWVKFAEQYYPDMLPHVSTCRSPQQMFGAMAKETLPGALGVKREDLVVVSIMPCTAKKFEAKREEFRSHGSYDVDHVITTQELGRMIEEAGLAFPALEPESFDLPFGFKTGAGVIFGNTGGVSEAVLRYTAEKLAPVKGGSYEFNVVRGDEGMREATVKVGDLQLRFAIVHGLANARRLMEDIKAGRAAYDFVEVMACPGGCVGGAGQPVFKNPAVRAQRARGLYENDKMHQLHRSQDNPYVVELYKNVLGSVGGEKAHRLLHTGHRSKRRTAQHNLSFTKPVEEKKLEVDVCFGTGCFMKGSQKLLKTLLHDIDEKGMKDAVEVKASFCFEKCGHGPVVQIGTKTLEGCTTEKAREALEHEICKCRGAEHGHK
jgi:NADH-quinone oxidoreductase subunit G